MIRAAERFVLEPGCSSRFSIAGIRLNIECAADAEPLVLSDAFRRFESTTASNDLTLSVGSLESLDPLDRPILYRGGDHWRARADEDATWFEIFYPPTSDVYCRMRADAAWSRIVITFGRRNLARLPMEFIRHCDGQLWLPHPFEQLALIPSLARRGGYLVHACGAVVGGRALVFAGHSGDGKTTLSRLLADESVNLLSDERVAVRRARNGGFVVHGTPWHGEGDVVSTESAPLGGIFVLRKAGAHGIETGNPGELAAELLARSLVPYYLGGDAERILSLVQETALRYPIRDLQFSLSPGLAPLLGGFVETMRTGHDASLLTSAAGGP